MPYFPNSTGNFAITKNTNDAFGLYLLSSGAPINLASTVISMRFSHTRVGDVRSFTTDATSPRLRSVLGLVGLVIFVVVTRWEPSVVRAAAMAGLILSGRALALPLDAWTALGVAVAGLLLFSGDLSVSVGFQLSVAATCGVLVGARLFADRRPKWLWSALGATLSAQVAVVPLLLLHFQTVPLLAPLANLMAAPVVTIATIFGGVGVLSGVSILVARCPRPFAFGLGHPSLLRPARRGTRAVGPSFAQYAA